MNIEDFRAYCLNLKGVDESFPFGEDTLVFKVMGKMFALTGLDEDFRINLKCNPEKAIELRERYPGVIPGYHMNKKHWNTVSLVGSLEEQLIFDLIDHSWEMTVKGFNRATREKLGLF